MARNVSKKFEMRPPVPTLVGAGITEQWYFTHMRTLKQLKVKIRPRLFGREDIEQIDKRIQDILNNNGIAVAVFDTDTAAADKKEAARLNKLRAKYADDPRVMLCDSMPSIEYWFLLHYEEVFKLFETSAAVIAELHKHIPAYKKKEAFLKNENWVRNMIKQGALSTAIQRAKHSEQSPGGSYTRIHHLFNHQP